MIDRGNRDVSASVLQDLIDGKITNDEFMSRFKFPKNTDPAVRAIFIFAWGQFSDLRAHKLTGRHAPTPERRTVLDRCVLVLHRGLVYQRELDDSKPLSVLGPPLPLRRLGMAKLIRLPFP